MEWNNCRFLYPSQPIECVFIKMITNQEYKFANQPDFLPANMLAVARIHHRVSNPVSFQKCLHSKRSTATINILQLPLRQGLTLTIYAVQGNQFPNYITEESKPRQFYTQFSRCSTFINNISINFPLTQQFLMDSAPPQSLRNEMNRLSILDETTISSHKTSYS